MNLNSFVTSNLMTNYRITKYDPSKRNEQGHYIDSTEWTAISDIGKPEYNLTSYSEYEKVENSYVESIMEIMKINHISELKISDLESRNTKQDFEEFEKSGRLKNVSVNYETEIQILSNGTNVMASPISKLIRLILRESIWMKLNSPQLIVEFGYDYYMYVKCQKLASQVISKIEELGLYVETYNI